jgi:methylthioribulose-1-phosphate dehydratase
MAQPASESPARHPPSVADDFLRSAELLAEVGQSFYRRGWMLGTSGNLSVVVSSKPLRLAITASGLDKGHLTANQIVVVDEDGQVVLGEGRPSAETKLHLAIVRARGAGAVLHTHSVWSTLLSDLCAEDRGLAIEEYEMLKGLAGVETHAHREWLPILENSQDCDRLAETTRQALEKHPMAHGFLLRRHGLYTWGRDISDAKQHVEILEFLLEVVGRKATLPPVAQKSS